MVALTVLPAVPVKKDRAARGRGVFQSLIAAAMAACTGAAAARALLAAHPPCPQRRPEPLKCGGTSGVAKAFLLKSSFNLRNQHSCVYSTRRCRAEARPEVSRPTAQPSVAPPKIPDFVNSVVKGQLDSENGNSSGNGNGEPALVGEDAAVFDVVAQKTSSWIYFTLVLGVVLAILNYIWLDPNTGYGGAFIDGLYSLSSNHEIVMLAILAVFALVHSGLAGLRAQGEKLVGERAYRVFFAGISLPLAVSAVVYFINHRYDGIQLWQVRTVPGVHEAVWVLSFISFLFLYPSTFNLLEVAAVDKPKVHMWETGIMRITRHPQMVGQFIWCLAHAVWIGNSFTLTTSFGLLAHHLFGVWHGDKRLAAKYGDAFEQVKERTSIIPFAAILDGRQKLPNDYFKEFLRVPYYVIVVLTIGAYFSHPLMQLGSHILHW